MGATEINISPQGELLEIHIDEFLVIYIKPISLPHRHDVPQTHINYLIAKPSKGERPMSNTAVRTSQPRAKQQPQVQKKKPVEEDSSYVPNKKITIEDTGHETRGKLQSKQKRQREIE